MTQNRYPGGVTGHEVRRVWGDQLRPGPANLINPRLSAPSRDFLASVGLPTIGVQEIVPFPDDRQYRYGIELATDRVFCLSSEQRFLVNSSVAFVLFLGIYQRTVLELTRTDEDALVDAVLRVRGQLRIRDPQAATDDGYWWPNLDQVASEYE